MKSEYILPVTIVVAGLLIAGAVFFVGKSGTSTPTPNNGTAQWHDLSAGLGDQPILGITYDGANQRLYVATDFGVLVRERGSWLALAAGLPKTAVYQLVLDQGSHLLYAATHGRGAYRINPST